MRGTSWHPYSLSLVFILLFVWCDFLLLSFVPRSGRGSSAAAFVFHAHWCSSRWIPAVHLTSIHAADGRETLKVLCCASDTEWAVDAQAFEIEWLSLTYLLDVGVRGAEWWRAKRGSVVAGRIAAMSLRLLFVEFLYSSSMRLAWVWCEGVAWCWHRGESVIDLRDEEWEVALASASETADKGEELVKIVAWSVLEAVLIDWYAGHDICKGAGDVKKLLHLSSIVSKSL